MMIYRETVKLCEMFVKLLTNEKKYAIMYHRKQQRRCFGRFPKCRCCFFVYLKNAGNPAGKDVYYETD